MRTQRGTRRGFSLGAALLTFLVAFVVLVTVATTSTFSLQMAAHLENAQTAQRLANSIVHQAIAKIVKDPTFHGELNLQSGDAIARLTFLRNLGTAYSTNNWEGDAPSGWGRGVPRGMIHLVASAHCRGVERRVETLVDMPVYPMTVACSGPLTLDKSTVASVNDDVMDEELPVILSSPMGPANVGSNSNKVGNSIQLSQTSHITGFVQSCGDIKNLGAQVDGEIRARWPEVTELPDMSPSMLDPRKPDPSEENVLYNELPAGAYGDLEVNSHNVVAGSLTVNGPLTLNDSLLFVDGDLTITGGLNGQGAVGVRGKVQISGASHLRAQSRVAVIADGDVQLLGTGKTSQRFEGILYSKGTIKVQSVTLLGSCIQNAPAGSAANQIGVVITDSNVLFNQRKAGPAFNPPIDLLVSTLHGTSSIEDVTTPASREADSLVGRSNVRHTPSGAPAGPGNQKVRANWWEPDDVFVLRTQFDSDGKPRFAATWWGRDGDEPHRKPDGSPRPNGLYYESAEALISLNGQGFGPFDEKAIYDLLADTAHSHPPNGQNNLPSVVARGVSLSGGFHEFGHDCDVNEAQFRANLRATVNSLLARSDALKRRSPNPNAYYSLDPSRFLSRTLAVHLHYWREF